MERNWKHCGDKDQLVVSDAIGHVLPGGAQIGYRGAMSMLFRQIARYVAQKVASDPEAKDKALKAARVAVDEAKQIASEKDRAYAAGKACRRAFDSLLNNR